MTVYIRDTSKAAINRRDPRHVPYVSYSYMGEDKTGFLADLPAGTVVKVYEKTVHGNPYAKSYGQWDGKKVK